MTPANRRRRATTARPADDGPAQHSEGAPDAGHAVVRPVVEGLTDAGIVMDIGAAVAHLHEQGVADESIGIVGFCMGGRVTFLASLEFALGAAVGFCGGGIVSHRFPRLPPLLERAGELKTP